MIYFFLQVKSFTSAQIAIFFFGHLNQKTLSNSGSKHHPVQIQVQAGVHLQTLSGTIHPKTRKMSSARADYQLKSLYFTSLEMFSCFFKALLN